MAILGAPNAPIDQDSTVGKTSNKERYAQDTRVAAKQRSEYAKAYAKAYADAYTEQYVQACPVAISAAFHSLQTHLGKWAEWR